MSQTSREERHSVAAEAPAAGQPPLIFIPGFPFHPFPNPAATANAKPGYLGVTLDTDQGAQEDGDGKKAEGVGILSVMEDSPAAKAGLREGSRLDASDHRCAS